MTSKYYIKTICPEISKVIQEKLFSLGYRWPVTGKTISHLDAPLIAIWNDMEITFEYLGDGVTDEEEISLHELMSWNNKKSFDLNDLFTATLQDKGLKVVNEDDQGASCIPYDRLVTLAEAIEEVKKEEDFEPFLIDVICPEISEVVQKELFKRGYEWRGWDRGDVVRFTNKRILILNYHSKKAIIFGHVDGLKQITLEEFFSRSRKEISVTLTDSWTAVVTKESVKVGCQTFDIKKIEELISFCREQGKI
jgi:hypothetical protein